jgi:hypothetical protein
LSQGFPDDVQALKDERLPSANETLNILLTHKATTQGADAACSMTERLKVLPESPETIPYFHEGVLADGNTGVGATTCTRSSEHCVNSRTHTRHGEGERNIMGREEVGKGVTIERFFFKRKTFEAVESMMRIRDRWVDILIRCRSSDLPSFFLPLASATG